MSDYIDISDLLPVDYGIKDELIIRKILENSTPYQYEFQKNNDIRKPDLKAYKYLVYEDLWKKKYIGLVEIERALKWQGSEIPRYWYAASFLKRKLFKYDWGFHKFTNNPVDHSGEMIYMKFSNDYKGCFCQSSEYIIKNGKDSRRNGNLIGVRCYNDSYYELKWEDVDIGLNDCIDFIIKRFDNV